MILRGHFGQHFRSEMRVTPATIIVALAGLALVPVKGLWHSDIWDIAHNFVYKYYENYDDFGGDTSKLEEAYSQFMGTWMVYEGEILVVCQIVTFVVSFFCNFSQFLFPSAFPCKKYRYPRLQ